MTTPKIHNPQQQVKLVQSDKQQYAVFLNKQIGRGGFGRVYKAADLSKKQQELAVKVISISDSAKYKQIQSELRIIKELPAHANLISIRQTKCYSANNYYLFMEYGDSSLAKKMRQINNAPWEEEEVYRLLYEVVQGYKVLYDKHILHHDLKPDNILIKKGTYKIADFGLSGFLSQESISAKRHGTLQYIAPEKLLKKDLVASVKSDIYSLGVILFEVITGRHPYLDYKQRDTRQFANDLREAKLRLPNKNTISNCSLQYVELFDTVLRMIKKNDKERLDFEELYNYVSKGSTFEQFSHPSSCSKVQPEGLMLAKSESVGQEVNFDFVGVSKMVSLPLDTPEAEAQKIRQKLIEQQEKQKKEYQQKTVKDISEYIIKERILVYYFDKLARRLTVQQMKYHFSTQEEQTVQESSKDKEIPRSIHYDRAVTYLMITNRCLLHRLVKEIQVPTVFSLAQWRLFRNSSEKVIVDLIIKDHRHVQDSTCDLLTEQNKIGKNELKLIISKYKENNLKDLLEGLKNSLQSLMAQRVTVVDVSNKGSLVTIVYMITAIEIVQHMLDGRPQQADLENYHRLIQVSDRKHLLEIIQDKCGEWDLMYSLDLSGLDEKYVQQFFSRH